MTISKAAEIEIVSALFLSAAEQMRRTLVRTAFNAVIYEVLDFGISIADAKGRMVAEAAGITSFRLAGKGTAAANNAIVAQLRDQFGIVTVRRGGVAKGQCIRVSPAIYTSEAELDRLVQALRAITSA